MKIKNRLVIILTIGCLLPIMGYAGEFEGYFASVVRATNNLTLGVSVVDVYGTNSTERPIALLFKAPTNTHSAFFLPQEEYVARLELYDSNNHPITKTELGSKYGKYFDDLYWDIKKFATPHNGGHPTLLTVNDKWDNRSWGRQLPKISDLFIITKSGTYRLKLEVQVMVYYLNMMEKQTRQIVRFPPMEILVIRPEDIPQENLPANNQTNSPAK